MAVVEAIAVGLALHLGKKAMDWVWDAVQDGEAPVVNPSGNLGFAAWDGGRTVVAKELTVPEYQVSELLYGNLYLPDTITDYIGDPIPLVLIIEEIHQQVLFFAADLEAGYEVYLPHGIYSFFVFLMDADSEEFMDAEIHAVGFPSAVDLSDIARIDVDEHDDIWDIVISDPIEITSGGPYSLGFILIDTDREPELPRYFYELVDANRVCDFCLTVYEEYSADWRITRKGNFKCEECGVKNDFAECERCESTWFRETNKGNYRCFNCDRKLKFY